MGRAQDKLDAELERLIEKLGNARAAQDQGRITAITAAIEYAKNRPRPREGRTHG